MKTQEKYKLVNLITKEARLCDKVTIDGFDYYVSNVEIKPFDYFYNKDNNQIQQADKDFDDSVKHWDEVIWFKVIATNKMDYDLHRAIDEDDKIERLAVKNSEKKIRTDIFHDASLERRWNFEGFVDGYKKSQETHPFSEEDMIEFAEWLNRCYKPWRDKWMPNFELIKRDGNPNDAKTTKELFQIWKEQQPKIIYYK